MCHLYPYNNVKLLRKFFYINNICDADVIKYNMEQSTAHCDISDVITDVQAAAEDSAVRPLLPLTVLLRPFASVFA